MIQALPPTLAAKGVALASRWAEFYRSRGWNALPSRTDDKRPLVLFAHLWDEPAPSDLFVRKPTTNIQLMTGRRWRLLVIDLDGDEAREWFTSLGKPIPRTWVTHSGGGGQHLWFRLPADYPEPLPKVDLWKGDGKHSAVERLCDRSLVMAPPSIHPKTGQRYRFLSPGQSPQKLPMPADCPAWILALPPVAKPAREPLPTAHRPPPRPIQPGAKRYRADDVLVAISDPVGLARSWGLKTDGDRPNHAGWIPCHAIGRDDRTPSASISSTTGRYWEPGERAISLFELAVRLGAYLDWRDAVNDLGGRYA